MLLRHTRPCFLRRLLAAPAAFRVHCSRSARVNTTIITSNSNNNSSSSTALLSCVRLHGDLVGDRDKELTLHVELPDGTKRDVAAYEGQTILDVAAEQSLPIEGACGGSCACSTCHVYLENDAAMGLFEEPTDEENDMLDMAFFPQSTSRLGCQLKLVKEKHDGLNIKMPRATRNMYVDGHTVTPH